MSETGEEKPIKITHNPDWQPTAETVYEYETHYMVHWKEFGVERIEKPIIDTRPPFIENPDGTVMR